MGKMEGERGAGQRWRTHRFGGADDEVLMECELDQPSSEVVTVMEFNAHSNTFKERITDESQIYS